MDSNYVNPTLKQSVLSYLTITDSAFKKIKILQEASLDHHPTTVSCPTPARRRHRTTFTQVCGSSIAVTS